MRFEHPALLWLALALPLAAWLFLWWTSRTRRQLLTQFIQARLLPELTVGESPRRAQGRALLLGSAAALLGIVLARPQWGSSWQEATQKGLDIVVAIDTSKSMLAEDIRPNRLTRAKLAAVDLMRLAQADRLGLIAFAGGAFLQCPLTLDDGVFKQCVDDLNVNIIPQGGTAVAEAIRTAIRALEDNQNFQVLVLFTDGEDHDPDAVAAAREAAEAGLRIYTIGLGTPEGELLRIPDAAGRTDFVRDSQGQVVKSRLNEELLKEIASAAQGFYLPLRGADTMDVLYEQGLEPLPKSDSEARSYRRYHERYHWPLALAILLIVVEILWPRRLAARQPQRAAGVSPADHNQDVATRGEHQRNLTRHASSQNFPRDAGSTLDGAVPNGFGAHRGKSAAAAAVLALFMTLPAHASPSSAQHEFESGNFSTALEEFDRLREKEPTDARLHFNAGAAAYRAAQFEAALERFTAAIVTPELQLQQRAYYNRGNTHYRSGEQRSDRNEKRKDWEQAVADYEAALKLNAGDKEAQFNLDYVKRKLEELEQQQDQQDQSNDNQDQQDQSDQQQDQQSQQHDQQQQNQDQPQQDSQSQQNQEQQNERQDQQQENQSEDSSGQQQDKAPDKTQDQQQEQSGSDSAGDSDPQQSEQNARPRQPGEEDAMTPEQARRLLDAQMGEEQMLPLMMPQPRQPPAKDW